MKYLIFLFVRIFYAVKNSWRNYQWYKLNSHLITKVYDEAIK